MDNFKLAPKQCSENCMRLNDFTRWLTSVLGPVLIGQKPAEILSFDKNHHAYDQEMDELEFCATTCKKLSLFRVETPNNKTKLIIYDPLKLDADLNHVSTLKFLRDLGYPEQYTLYSYLEHLAQRLKSDDFPHEIGLFLGYPLKDILGFLGHPSLKLTRVGIWRIYGAPDISEKRMRDFEQARRNMDVLLNYRTPEYLLRIL